MPAMTDTISSDDGRDWPAPEQTPPRPRRPSRGVRTVALTTAVSMVLVGGIATAAVRNFSRTSNPMTVVPASAFAVAQVDLSLPNGQADGLSRFLAHFPSAPHGSGAVRDRVLAALLADSTDPHVDYQRDVRPWLGDTAVVAGWVDGSGQAQLEIVLASTDDDAARSSLHRVAPSLGVNVTDGFVVLGTGQAATDEAVREAQHKSLADVATYNDDIAALDGQPVLTGWVDGPAAMKAFSRQIGADAMSNEQLLTVTGVGGSFDSRLVSGLRVDDHSVQFDLIQRSGRVGRTSTSDLIRHLPDSTLAAVEIADPGGVVRRGSAAFTAALGMLGTDPLKELNAATGLTLPGDVETLLGSRAVFAYGGLSFTGVPKIALRSRPDDPAAATGVAARLGAFLHRSVSLNLTTKAVGDDVVMATTGAFADAVASTGSLGRQQRFADAMAGLPDSVAFAAYADLASFVPLVNSGQSPDLDHLKAIGLWAGAVAGHAAMRIRLVVG
jgi:hypothetical protein